jgi:serine protease Do
MLSTKRISIGIIVLSMFLLAACGGVSSSVSVPAGLLSAPALTTSSVTVAQGLNPSAGSLAAYQGTLEQIYAQVNPSVVNVEVVATVNTPFSGTPFGFNGGNTQTQQRALGSGFVWDNQGHIVTNNHVIDGANKIAVTFADGTTTTAKLVGADPNSDLAVIQVNVPSSDLHPVQLADSTQVKVGQVAIAIGNPFGLSGTMTAGIISGLERSLPVGLDNPNSQGGPTYAIPDIIQTDASINPGNSGGVLVDDQGQLIGVTAAIESPSNANAGIGFVIPANIVQKVVPSLIKTGKYEHPWLGISGTSLTPDLAKANNLDQSQQGVLIVDVTNNGPADRAGLQGSDRQVDISGQPAPVGGDVIVAIDGQPVKRFEDMGSYLFENAQVGQTITVTILRNGNQKDIQVKLGVLPNP